MFSLVFPNISHQDRYLAMIAEWQDFEAIPASPTRLFAWESYADFLDMIVTDVTNSSRWVNSTLFFFMQDDGILGAIQIRHHIDHPHLRESGGHIWYSLRPSARGKWYAQEMLSLGLIEAKKLGIDTVMISAHEDNPASWRTIESCGWILQKIIEKDEKLLRIYSINI